jgi:hypothetical protein
LSLPRFRTSIVAGVSLGTGTVALVVASWLWYSHRHMAPGGTLKKLRPSASSPALNRVPVPEAAAPFDLGAPQLGCEARCEAVASPALVSALERQVQQAAACWERTIEESGPSRGDLVVALQISRSGDVCRVRVQTDQLKRPAVTSCVLRLLRGARLAPAPVGGCVALELPLHFAPEP